MSVAPVSPALLPFMATAIVVFGAAAAVAMAISASGRAAAARAFALLTWLFGAAAVASVGYAQYGLAAVPPAAVAVGLSMAIVYALAGRGRRQLSWPRAATRCALAALLAGALLPVALLLLLALLGIDGP